MAALEDLAPFGFIIGGLAIFGVIALLSFINARKRTQALQEWAESLGFDFKPIAGLELIYKFPDFKFLNAGKQRRVTNLLTGATESTQVMIFDWIYVTGSGKHRATHRTTVVVIQSDELDLPAFLCRPETVFDKIGLSFDGRDIDFVDRPVFSKKYHLHGTNESRVQKLFDHDVCDFFETHEGIFVEGLGKSVIYYQPERVLSVAKAQEQFKNAFQLYVLLKGASGERSSSADDSTTAISDQSRDEMSSESERQF